MSAQTRLDTEWMERGACKGKTHLFFTDQGGNVPRTVKAICNSCPVEADCLAYARALPTVPGGIWAGRTGREIRATMTRPATGAKALSFFALRLNDNSRAVDNYDGGISA